MECQSVDWRLSLKKKKWMELQELGGGHIPRLCLPGTQAVGDSVYQKGSNFKLVAREGPVHWERIQVTVE